MENGVFRRSDMTIKIKVLNVWGSVICNIEKMGIGFFSISCHYIAIFFYLCEVGMVARLKRLSMETFRFEIQCPSRDRGLCSGNLLLVDRGGMCVHAQLQTEDRYLSNRMVGENIFDLFPASASGSLRAGFSTLWSGRKGFCEDLYECAGETGELSVYYVISMSRYDDFHAMIRLRNISYYINKHERLLRQEEQKVEDLKRLAGIGVWKYDSKKQRLESKGYADPMFQPGEYREMDMAEYFSRMSVTDVEKVKEYIRGLDAGLRQESIQYMMHYQYGDVVLRVEPISCRPSDGGYLWEGYVQNVTDLITGQTRIEMLRQAIDSVSEDVFAVEPDGSLAFANKTFLEHNVSDRPRDVIGEKVFDLNKTLVDKTQWGDWLRSLRENGGSWNFTQDRMSDGQGEAMTFENYSYLIENQLHQELIWVFARDISERLKREDEINSLQYLTNSIINNIPVGLYVKDVADDFKYLFCNRSAFDFLRSGREDVIGKNDFEIFGRSKAEAIRNEDLQLVSDRTKIERTGQVGGASGSPVTYEEVRIYSEKKDGTPLIIGVFWDITSRVALEKELVEAKEKAEESGRLKSAFLANMSHEIRTPLNAIVGFSNIIAETQDMEERRGMYKIVETNNERLLSLINEILDMSKIEAGMLELSSKPVNMRVLCGELLNANLFRCPGNVIFSFDGSSPNLVTRTDPNRLFQVFANLITNAFKFTDSGRVTFGYRLDGPNIVCYVEDTGSGIETDKQDKIFDRFVKGNDFAQGTGLGLPICKVLIEKMGGRIGVESAIGRGTKFVFTIPYVPPVNERAGSGNPDGQKTSVRKAGARKAISGTVTVLVVESEPSDFDLLCDTFGDGIFFVRADSGVEAVTLFEQYRPQLVLLNVAVTDMHCAEVAGIIKEVSPGVPVVAFGDSAPTDCYDDFMAVPWSREQVERLFNKYL